MYENLYASRVGRILARALAAPWISRLSGRFMDSRVSRLLIKPFIKKNQIDLTDVLPADYRSFNQFFVRRLVPGARPFSEDAHAFSSPCDGLLSVYPVSEKGVIQVKNTPYTLETLTESKEYLRAFNGGYMLVFRLTPSHYHHYAFPDGGEIIKTQKIPGIFHTVRPQAVENLPVYKTNTREYACLRTENFSDMLYMEVGATLVGRIKNLKTEGHFAKGEEKGMFEFGGSTVILITAPGAFFPNQALRNFDGKEIPVRMGETLGYNFRQCSNV